MSANGHNGCGADVELVRARKKIMGIARIDGGARAEVVIPKNTTGMIMLGTAKDTAVIAFEHGEYGVAVMEVSSEMVAPV